MQDVSINRPLLVGIGRYGMRAFPMDCMLYTCSCYAYRISLTVRMEGDSVLRGRVCLSNLFTRSLQLTCTKTANSAHEDEYDVDLPM